MESENLIEFAHLIIDARTVVDLSAVLIVGESLVEMADGSIADYQATMIQALIIPLKDYFLILLVYLLVL